MLQQFLASLSYSDVLGLLLTMHKEVAPLLQQLSRKTRVLFHAETRQRPHGNGWESNAKVRFARRAMFGDAFYDLSERILQHYLEKELPDEPPDATVTPAFRTVPEAANGLSGRPTGVWWWDSTLPHHLATVLECNDLYRRNLTHLKEYSDLRNNCQDQFHSGATTLGLEVAMLLNFLCNSYVKGGKRHCCS